MNKEEAIKLLICEKACVEDVDGNIGGERVRQAYDMAIQALQEPTREWTIQNCPKCGKFVLKDWIVCPYCGASMQPKDGEGE